MNDHVEVTEAVEEIEIYEEGQCASVRAGMDGVQRCAATRKCLPKTQLICSDSISEVEVT